MSDANKINNLLHLGESVAPTALPKHGSQGWAYGYQIGEIENSANTEGNSVVLDLEPEGASEPVVIVSDITLTTRPIGGKGKAVIWNTEQEDDAVKIVDLDPDNPLVLKKNDAYYYLNTGEERLLIRDDSVPAFKDGDEVMLNAKPGTGRIDGRNIEVPIDFLRAYGLARKSPEAREQTIIRAVRSEDIDDLHPVFETWIRDRDTGELLADEIAELEAEIRSSIDGDDQRKYFVAEDTDGKAIGIMGMQSPPYKELVHFTTSDNPMEIINAYVDSDKRQSGTGKALVRYIEDQALQQGNTELLVNSGPRYRDTGWPFWTKLYGKPVGTAVGFYGPGGDAMIWRKSLVETK